MIFIFVISALIVIVAFIGTMQVAKTPNDDNYDSEKGRNMLRLFWIYLLLIIFILIVALAMIYFN